MDILAEALRHRVQAQKRVSLAAYLASLESGNGAYEELRTLASYLTVGETYFFRIADHFQALAEKALPERIRLVNQRRPLRFLSAGCASGDEAYSLAIVLRHHFPQVPQSEVAITGVDLNPAILVKAREARYTSWSLRETTPQMQARYFHADGKYFALDNEIRCMVNFEEGNLAAAQNNTLWESELYDVIFCRNVMMYMVPEAARVAVARLTQALAPEGFLFLSPSETLRGISHDFHLRHTHNAFYYQKREEEETKRAALLHRVTAPRITTSFSRTLMGDAYRLASGYSASPSVLGRVLGSSGAPGGGAGGGTQYKPELVELGAKFGLTPEDFKKYGK